MRLNLKFTFVIILITAIPVAIATVYIFFAVENNLINEQRNYMEYKISQDSGQITSCLDSINMSVQLFLADEETNEVLCKAQNGIKLGTKKAVEYQETNITNLERVVSNNPTLYSVRVYATSDTIQEMNPILFKKSRMENMSWGKEEDPAGWHFGYYDTAFSSLTTRQETKLVGLVTPIIDYRYGRIGYIEAAVIMQKMFPNMYINDNNEYALLVAGEDVYRGFNEPKDFGEYEDDIIGGEHLSKVDPKGEVAYIKTGGHDLMVSYYPIKKFGATLVSIMDISESIGEVRTSRNVVLMIIVLLFVGLAFVINHIVNRMLRQFYLILSGIKEVEEGNLNVRIEHTTNDEMGELGNNLNNMLDGIQALMQENIDREILAKNSEIRALQNQINAHFIYNVLESIKMMAEINEEYEMSDAITALGKLLRYSMRWVSRNVKLRDEMDYIHNYMILINLRYDYEVHLSVKIPEELLEQEIPKMSIQPIIENAILHGIEPLGEESTIYIKGWADGDDFFIEVTDAGTGMTDEELEDLEARMQGQIEPAGGKSNGIGLKNVHDRIRMSFGNDYGLKISTRIGCYTKVMVHLPSTTRKVD